MWYRSKLSSAAIGILAILLLAAAPMWAAVTVQVQVLPPYSPHLSDYFGQQNKVLVTLTGTAGSEQQKVRLACTFSGNNGVKLVTDPSFKPAQPVIIVMTNSVQLTGSALAAYFD